MRSKIKKLLIDVRRSVDALENELVFEDQIPAPDVTASVQIQDFLRAKEAFRSRAYDDWYPNRRITRQDQVKGRLTIGYGHTKTAKVGQEITEAEAEALFQLDLDDAEDIVTSALKVPVSQGLYDALVSHAFNCGKASETIYKMVNNGDPLEDLAAWWRTHYITAKGANGKRIKMNGLVTRREKEVQLFLA